MNAGERPAEDRRNALYMRAQQNSAAARLTMHFGVAAGLTAVISACWSVYVSALSTLFPLLVIDPVLFDYSK